jgi:hypothetical protein
MLKSIRRTSIALLAITFLSVTPVNTRTVRAQNQPTFPFQYAVKFICGRAGAIPDFQILARGTYFTVINIHNPLLGNVSFRKKLVSQFRLGEPGPIRPFTDIQLSADGALEFTCRNIALEVIGKTDEQARRVFLEGFVVIESRTELDVVALYTTGKGDVPKHPVVAMSLERVPVRRLALPDLLPAPDAKGNFCRRDENGRLIITIQNQGLADAGASITRVDFATGGFQLITTPAIPAGRSVEVLATFPPGCFRPDCTFRLAVDSTGFVSEASEGNNVAGGTCKG